MLCYNTVHYSVGVLDDEVISPLPGAREGTCHLTLIIMRILKY